MPRLLDDVVVAGTLAAQPQPVLDLTAGRRLRPWRAKDVDALVAVYADPAIQRWHHRRWDPDEAAAWIEASHRAWRAETGSEWAVVEADAAAGADVVVGRVALHEMSLVIGQAEVSYWTAPAARGRGLAPAAVDAVARWILTEVGFWRLEVRHSTRNPASCAVAERAGFVHEATLGRQHLHDDGWHDVHVHSRHREPRSTPASGS